MSTEKKEVVLVARSLGEGIITKCLKRYAFIDEERLGKIYVPVEACLPSSQSCNDLRDIFKENDCVVFTAQRRNPASNDCNYFANSIIKKSDLILVEGRIVEVNEKYAYSETSKYGRIFMPFSAKNEYNRPWVGRGAAIDKKITMKIMPQPEVNKCHYVAWAVFVDFCLANGANRSLSALMLTNPSPLSLNCGNADDNHHLQSVRHSVDDSPSLASTEWPMYCITTDSGSSSSSRGGRVLERQAEVVLNLLAIVIAPAPPPQNSVQETANNWALTTQNREMLAYAPQTGLVRIGVCEDICPVGSFVFFDAQKCLSIPPPQTPGTPSTPKLQQQQTSPHQNNREKCTWMATSIEPVGELIEVIPGCASCFAPYNEERLTVEVDALVCRVSKSNNSAWLWNDLIGRIFVNGHAYRAGMRSLEMVRCRCQFTASFEDVPWSAIDIQLLGDNLEKRNEFSQLLLTDDGWKVQYVNEQQSGTFFGFMIHEEHGSAFVAWTDTIGGDAPPAKGDICRATLYRQLRDRKHQWRAVMVSKAAPTTVKNPEEAKKVADALNRRHPLWPTSGRLALQFLAKRSPDGRNVIRLVGSDVDNARKSSSGSVVIDSNGKKKLLVKGSGGQQRNGQVTTPTSFADAAGASATRRADSPVTAVSFPTQTAEPRPIAAIGSQRMKKTLKASGGNDAVAVMSPPPGFGAPPAISMVASVPIGEKMSSRIYSSESSDGSSPNEAFGNNGDGVGVGGTTAYEFDAKFFQSSMPINGVNDTTANTSPITFDAVGLCGLRATNGGCSGKQDTSILPYDGRDKAWQELRAISVSSPPQQPPRNGASPWAFDGGGLGSPFIDINNEIGKDSPTLFLPSLNNSDLKSSNGDTSKKSGDSNGNFSNGVTSNGDNPCGGFSIINNNTNIRGNFNISSNGGIGGFKPDSSLFNAFMSINNGGISDSSLNGSNCCGNGLLHRAAVTSKDAGTQTEMDVYDMLSVALRHRQHLFKRFFQENAEIRQLLRELTTEKYTNNIKQ